jgi:hypothetical protein
VTSFEGENIILFTISVHLKSVLIKGVAFGESGLVTRGILYNQGLLLKYCTIELNLTKKFLLSSQKSLMKT